MDHEIASRAHLDAIERKLSAVIAQLATMHAQLVEIIAVLPKDVVGIIVDPGVPVIRPTEGVLP